MSVGEWLSGGTAWPAMNGWPPTWWHRTVPLDSNISYPAYSVLSVFLLIFFLRSKPHHWNKLSYRYSRIENEVRLQLIILFIIKSATTQVIVCVLFVIPSLFVQDYCNYKSNQPISLQLGAMIGPSNRKNWLNFAGDQVPDTDFGSLFHFPHHCGIGVL